YSLFVFVFKVYSDPSSLYSAPLSLHDALPISPVPPTTSSTTSTDLSPSVSTGFSARSITRWAPASYTVCAFAAEDTPMTSAPRRDRKSTRLNSSHVSNSYAVFCLKKKNHLPHH